MTNSFYKDVHGVNRFHSIDYLSERLPELHLDGHVELFLVWCQVVALSQKDLPKRSLSQLPLQDDVVSLDVLDNFEAEEET